MFKTPPEEFRIIIGRNATKKENGPNGVFHIPLYKNKWIIVRSSLYGYLQCVASDEHGWERIAITVVSPSKTNVAQRFPTIGEIQIARETFWDKDDRVMMPVMNPPKEDKDHINTIPRTVILCKKIGSIYEMP